MKGKDIARVRRQQAVRDLNRALNRALNKGIQGSIVLSAYREAYLNPACKISYETFPRVVDPYEPPRPPGLWSALFGGPGPFDDAGKWP